MGTSSAEKGGIAVIRFRCVALPMACALMFSVHLAQAQGSPPGALPEVPKNSIEYGSVAAALDALRRRKDVQISMVRGWTIIADPNHLTLWSFAPETDPAYPAAVMRVVRSNPSGGSYIDMSVLCEASKEACDNMVRQFEALNNQLPH